MRILLLSFVVLLGFISLTSGAPVSCSAGANVLEVEALSENCPVETTCQFTCSCGKSAFFDLTTMRYWTHPIVQTAWKRSCHAVSLEKWVARKTAEGVRSLPKKRSGWLRRKKADGKAIAFFRFLVSVFRIVEQRYRNICQGGRKLSSAEAESLKNYFVGRMNHFAATTSGMNVAKQIAGFMFAEFIARHHSNQFEFCSCKSFTSNIPFISMKNAMRSAGNQSCDTLCGKKKRTATPVRRTVRPIRKSRFRRSTITLDILEEEEE